MVRQAGNFATKKRMKGKSKATDGKAISALETSRPSDSELLILAVNRLLALARDTKDPASKPAGKLLAYIDALIAADREKLLQNEAYREERPRLGKSLRKDVWFPDSPLYQALHRELSHCWFYRGELLDPLTQPTWPVEEYRCLLKLPPLSLKSFPRWEKELWKLAKKHNPDLLMELCQKADRKQVVQVHSDGVTKYELKSLNLTWKLLRPQFRRHLRSIASAYG